MKKLLLFFMSLVSFATLAQLPEDFETTVPPSGWVSFDNGIGTAQSWTVTPGAALAYGGVGQSAFVNRENLTQGQTSEDWLVTPLVTIPADYDFRFFTRQIISGDQGTVYELRLSTTSQTDPASFTVIESWNEFELNSTYNVYEEKVVDMSANVGDVYIAFVKVYTKTTTSSTVYGDGWFIDNLRLTEKCLEPTGLSTSNPTSTSVTLNWTPNGPATQWEIEIIPTLSTPTGSGIIVSDDPPYTHGGLDPDTGYLFYIRSVCSDGGTSEWIGPLNFSTLPEGLNCASSIPVTDLPYITNDNTGSYGSGVSGPQGAGCAGGSTNYLAGNDVYYAFTPSFTGAVTITSTPTQANSSLFVYASCADVGISCMAGVADNTNNPREITGFNVVAGETYYIVISSIASVSNVDYTLEIQQENCPRPDNLFANNIDMTSADLSWGELGSATSWEVIVQTAGGGIPTIAGAQTNNNTAYNVTTETVSGAPLTSGTVYEFWVRSDCGDGTFSGWAGPFTFTTSICDLADKCAYTFRMTDSGSNGWQGNTMNVIQNGVVVATLGATFTSGAGPVDVVVLLCNNIPFELFWNSGGTSPNQVGISILDPTSSQIFSMPSNSSALQNTTLYTNMVSCTPASCQQPTNVTLVSTNSSSATVSWSDNTGGGATQWQVIALPAGSPYPTGTTFALSGIATTTNYTLTGLSSVTTYDIWVRAICSTTTDPNDPAFDASNWSGPAEAQTTPDYCAGDHFYDTGGPTGNYGNNETVVTTICPEDAGDVVTAIFNTFNLQSGDNLTVFNGATTASPVLATLTGSSLPNDFTSTAPTGCLTFRFTSNGSGTSSGWDATIICATPPSCPQPINLIVSGVNAHEATASWTEQGTATQWEVIILPAGSPSPLPTDTGIIVNATSYTFPSLDSVTSYDVHVRAICPSGTDVSLWSNQATFTTIPDYCAGDHFYDTGGATGNYASNENTVTTICPANPGEVVTVIFNTFDLEPLTFGGEDILNVYNGNSTTGTLIGSFSGTSIPPVMTSSDLTGCLTFEFVSDDNTTVGAGWDATITCGPPPSCPTPIGLTVSGSGNGPINLSWQETGTATQWEVVYQEVGTGLPPTGTSVIVNSTNVTLDIPVGFYEVYVRAICSDTEVSDWNVQSSIFYVITGLACSEVEIDTPNNNGVIDVCPNDNCVDLSATYFQSKTTETYTVESIAYEPVFPLGFLGEGLSYQFDFGDPNSSDDRWSGDINLPFDFCFFGAKYDFLSVSTNGLISFQHTQPGDFSTWSFSQTIPNVNFPIRNAIYGVYQDIDPRPSVTPNADINYAIYGEAPCRVFVFNVNGVNQYNCEGSTGPQTSQIVLYESSNVIDIYVQRRVPCTGWQGGVGVIGIQNAAGTVAFTPPGRNTGSWTTTNEAWRFTPNGTSTVDFAWYMNDEFYSSDADITVCVTEDATFTAQATYTDCDGVASVLLKTVEIHYNEDDVPAFSLPSPLCSGEPNPTLDTTSANGVTGSWTLGGNPVTEIDTSMPAGIYDYVFTPDPSYLCIAPVTYQVQILGDCTYNAYATAVYLENCETVTPGEFFNVTGGSTDAIGPISNVFTNNNYGTYVQNSGNLLLKGAQLKSFKGTASNVCAANMYYRIYEASTTPGTFSVVNLNLLDTCASGTFPSGGTCDEGDQKWEDLAQSVDLTQNAPGSYIVEVYFELEGNATDPSGCGEFELVNNNGNNYIANFRIQSVPTFTHTDEQCDTSNGTITISGFPNGEEIGVTYDYNDGTTTTTVGSVNYPVNGSGEVILTGLNDGTYSNFELFINGCTYNYPAPVIISNYTLAVNNISSLPICVGEDAVFVIDATPNTNVRYTINGGTVLTVPIGADGLGTITVPSPAVGTINLALSNIYNSVCNILVSNTAAVIVNPLPTASISSNLFACIGSDAVFTITGTPDSEVVYTINGGANESVMLDVTGNYTLNVPSTVDVQVTLVNITNTVTGCTNTISGQIANVAIVTVPVAEVEITQPTCSVPTGTIEVTSPLISQINYPGDLFISEITNSQPGYLSYIEIYNATGATVDLSNYKIKIYLNGSTTATCDLALSGTLVNDDIVVIRYGTRPDEGGVVADLSFPSCTASVNNNDRIALATITDVEIDVWGTPDGSVFTPGIGYNYQRVDVGTTLPSVTWDPADWILTDWGNPTSTAGDYTNVGVYTLYAANYEYILNDGTTTTTQATTTFGNVSQGDYTLVVYDAGTNCYSEPLDITINVPTGDTPITTFSYTTPVCEDNANLLPDTSTTGFTPNGEFTVIPAVGLDINSITGEINVVNSDPGTYTITYSVLASSCMSAGSSDFEITINSESPVTFAPIELCAGDVVNNSLPSTGGISGTWTQGGNPVSAIDTSVIGMFTYDFTPDAGQCATLGTLDVTITDKLAVSFEGVEICANATLEFPLESYEGYILTGTWSPSEITNSVTGTYIYTFTPDDICYGSGTFTVDVIA
ncbi:fibronectin type III domain-containing protein, partial [Flavobacterium sp. U410]